VVTSYPLARANEALDDLRSSAIKGAAVLLVDDETAQAPRS
jgi:hypothetical protein